MRFWVRIVEQTTRTSTQSNEFGTPANSCGRAARTGISMPVAVALALTGCATVQGGAQQTALDRSINQCVAAIGIGTLLGALASSQNRGRNALIGAGVGGVACTVLMAMNNEQDKQRIRNAQLTALNTGMPQAEQYYGQDGKPRLVRTAVSEVATPAAVIKGTPEISSNSPSPGAKMSGPLSPNTFVGPCRNTQSAITIQGQTAQLAPELYCRTAGGDWKLYGA